MSLDTLGALIYALAPPTNFALDKFTDDLVVEVVYGCPLYALANVLLLFCLQCQLNKDLLKLLVHKVDTELLKPVFLRKK